MNGRIAPRYIVVEGPIGVGKTSLAKRLASDFACELMLEDSDENPFLERFYQNPREAALSAQLFFLLQRARQVQALKQGDMFNPVRVADFMMEKDLLFAELNLDRAELDLYRQVYEHLTLDALAPDLVIYLQAPVSVLLKRIGRRGRVYERGMDRRYLDRLSAAYAQFFYNYERAPLLIVNAAEVDFIHNDADYEQLLQQVCGSNHGRRFFNPLPFGL